jgi:hypothetical protein
MDPDTDESVRILTRKQISRPSPRFSKLGPKGGSVAPPTKCLRQLRRSSDPGKVTGQRWPQPSMPSPFRQIYLDVKGEQSIEQLGLTIKMMLAEPAARNLFGALLE